MNKTLLTLYILKHPIKYKQVTKEEFRSYLEHLDELTGETIKCSYSSVYDTELYYSPRLERERGVLLGVNDLAYYPVGKMNVYAEPIYYINENFERVFKKAFKKSPKKKDSLPTDPDSILAHSSLETTDHDTGEVHKYILVRNFKNDEYRWWDPIAHKFLDEVYKPIEEPKPLPAPFEEVYYLINETMTQSPITINIEKENNK